MGSIGAPEVLVILVLALLVLGPERLPQAARTMGRWMGQVRKLTGSLQAEVRDVVDEVMRPVNETATVATQSFTSTFESGDTATTVVDTDGAGTEALPSVATSEARPSDDVGVDAEAEAGAQPAAAGAEPASRLAADIPLPRVLPAPPIDPSLN